MFESPETQSLSQSP